MADVLTTEELQAMKAAELKSDETTTAANVDTALGATPEPVDAILAQPGAPRDIHTFTHKGDPLVLTIAKPVKPVALMVTKILGFDSTNQGLFIYYRALAWLTGVNGTKVGPLTKREDFENFAELIGDEALETLATEVFSSDLVEQVSRAAVKKS